MCAAVGVLSNVPRDVSLSYDEMLDLMKIARVKLADGGTILTFCSVEQIADWRRAGAAAGLMVEKNYITGVKNWMGSKGSYAPHSNVVNICEYLVVCHRQDTAKVGFVNFDADKSGHPFIPTGCSTNYIVNGNVMSLHALAKGMCYHDIAPEHFFNDRLWI